MEKKRKEHWYVTNGGTVRVNIDELLKDPKVQQDIQKMRELFEKYGRKK